MKEPFIKKDNLLFIEPWMNQDSNLIAGFTTLQDGTSVGAFQGLNIAYHVGDEPTAVLNNRRLVAEAIQAPLEQWVFAEQLHTTNVHKVTSADLGAGVHSFESGIKATDGLYTTESNVVLATFYADCTPLYFYVPTRHLIGVAHAGWRGTVDGMMHEMLRTLKDVEGIKPEEIFVTIGPCIGRDAYRVDDTVIDEVKKSCVANVEETFVELGRGQYKFDPKLLNYKQALHEGVPAGNISVTSYCTYTDSDLFYSFRKNSVTGRMMNFMCLKN
ncbi:peptidoglycan editing factor PgeF [Turicibacter sanguinis]|uniref:peptidoglycan editing factor PgeF n=1 Tax=Turicibacter sanguinis TaxID=154288 RepID=UPI0011C85514|nr:peptidoglycan editing factor PgeF [Turicibacter sanguinis]